MTVDLRNKFMDFERMTLFAEGTEQGRRARFQFCMRDGYPRVTVYTGAQGKAGIIPGPMDPEIFDGFLSILEEIAKNDAEDKRKIALKTNVFEGDKRTQQLKVLSELWVGKDDKGIVWVALTAEGFPKLRFDFKISPYAVFYKKDGTEYTQAECSKISALSYVHHLRIMVPQYLIHLGFNPRPAPQSGGATATKAANTEGFEDISF